MLLCFDQEPMSNAWSIFCSLLYVLFAIGALRIEFLSLYVKGGFVGNPHSSFVTSLFESVLWIMITQMRNRGDRQL